MAEQIAYVHEDAAVEVSSPLDGYSVRVAIFWLCSLTMTATDRGRRDLRDGSQRPSERKGCYWYRSTSLSCNCVLHLQIRAFITKLTCSLAH